MIPQAPFPGVNLSESLTASLSPALAWIPKIGTSTPKEDNNCSCSVVLTHANKEEEWAPKSLENSFLFVIIFHA